MKVRKNLVLTTNTVILPILWTSAQKEVSSDLTCEPSLTSLETNPCSSPLKEFYNAQPFRELLGSSPNFPTVAIGFASARSPLPLLHSSTKRIPANNCPYQKKKSQQALRLQDMNICTANSAPKETLVQPGKRHLTCLPRKATAMPLQTNTYENLPCTSTDQLFTKIKKLNFWNWIPWEMHWYWGRCKFFPGLLRNSPWPPKRGFHSLSWLQRQENSSVQPVCNSLLYARKHSFLFPQRSPSHSTFHFQRPFLFRKSQTFISSLLFTALEFLPGQKSL